MNIYDVPVFKIKKSGGIKNHELYEKSISICLTQKRKEYFAFFHPFNSVNFCTNGTKYWKRVKTSSKKFNIGGSFNIDVNYSDSNPYYHEEESENEDGSSDLLMYSTEQVTSKMVENIRNISGVKFCDATTESLINFDKLLPFAGTVPLDESLSHCVKSIGVWRSEEQNFFTSGKVQLIEGRHILDNDIHKVIVCKDLAEKNNLKLGDSLIVTNEKQLAFEIVGLFHAQKLEKIGESIPTYDKIQNLIFTDIESIVELENSVAVQGFDTVKVTVNDPKDIEKIIEQVKHLPDYKENVYNIYANDEVYKNTAISLENLDTLVIGLLLVIIIASVIVLSLILTLWGKERIHETGVFLSIGIKKSSILGQYLIEVLMIAILAFTLSFVTSNMISGNIANTLLQQNTKNEKQQLSTQEDHTEMKSLDFSVSEDSESAIPDIKVEITLPDILQLYTIGFSIIFISVTISSISVMRLKPREILARMS